MIPGIQILTHCMLAETQQSFVICRVTTKKCARNTDLIIQVTRSHDCLENHAQKVTEWTYKREKVVDIIAGTSTRSFMHKASIRQQQYEDQ